MGIAQAKPPDQVTDSFPLGGGGGATSNDVLLHGMIDSLAGNIEPEMPNHIDQWYWPGSMSNWYEELEILTNFANTRLPVLTNNLKVRFDLDGSYNLTAAVSTPEYGSIQICGVDIPETFTGSYFMNLPVTIKAISNEGFTFQGWEGASGSGNKEIELILSNDASITAHFRLLCCRQIFTSMSYHRRSRTLFWMSMERQQIG